MVIAAIDQISIRIGRGIGELAGVDHAQLDFVRRRSHGFVVRSGSGEIAVEIRVRASPVRRRPAAGLHAVQDVPTQSFNDLAKATITELANMITGQAVTKLHELGFEFDLTPPAIITGENMQVTDSEVEALIVPVEMPQGKLEINVAVRERN